MNYHIDIQQGSNYLVPVSDEQLTNWGVLALSQAKEAAEITIRLVDVDEITRLNTTYRNQNKPTNVLAFPIELPQIITLEIPLVGDVIICPEVLQQESEHLGIPLQAHWAHIVIHGVLHLLGYDHIEAQDAAIMQPIEVALLKQLGFENPYER